MKTIAELKAANLPHATVAGVFTLNPKQDATPEQIAADIEKVTQYLFRFVPYQDNCIRCGHQLVMKSIIDSFAGISSFTWGLAHGEGFCFQCRWPSRAYHSVADSPLPAIILQYHPDGIEEPAPAVAKPEVEW